ncbi:MAG: hypothetical protein LUE12_00975 [Ruminococcus sp.]|nr:hypothetical protein [Ruminococcus sp.]
MSIITKLKEAVGKAKRKKIAQRIIAGAAAGAISMTTLVSSFPTITAEAATSGTIALDGEDIIEQACKVLGAKYSYGSQGTASRSSVTEYPIASTIYDADDVNHLDCAGLVYWTLTSLGVSTSGFKANCPVPYTTNTWLYDSIGNHITSSSALSFTYKNVTETKYVAKSQTWTKQYTGSGTKRDYWETSGSDIDAGSIVIAEGYTSSETRNSSADHMWIYLGEFDSTQGKNGRTAVINYLHDLTGISTTTLEKYVGDGSGAGGNHWRIECTSTTGHGNGSTTGVIINNDITGKSSGAYKITALTLSSGQIVLKKTFDDDGKYGQDSSGNVQITFTVTETNTDEKHSYSVKGTYNVSKGTWTQTKATNSDNVPDVDIGVTSGGSFYFKNIRVFDNGTNVKYKISEKVNSGSYEQWGGTTITLAKLERKRTSKPFYE